MNVTFLTSLTSQLNTQRALLRQSPTNARIVSNERIGGIAKDQVLGAIIYPQQQGFTLVEIMIALLIGVFLLGGVMGVFLNTKQTYSVQEALSRLQENGRFAMDFLAKDIRMADYRECLTTLPLADAVSGTDNDTDPANGFLDGSDSITIVWSEVPCLPPSAVTVPRTYGITDSMGLYQNTNLNVLVEGVENMQIQYGVDSDIDISTGVPKGGDGTANYYVDGTAANFPDWQHWAQIVSVRVSLLLQTVDDNIASEPLPYTYNGATFTPGDRRIRRVYTSTIALRNRIH
ncbi:PilW family protein [Methyloglobulus sp.]|uniref:PilW family protein n=1 Tax=Methyloglobulus sp. TaxID=2518622 RepID=UPI0018447965|nr:prepilin-type N-terminal cleavage/methylation domain-containing protein [Methyloglobulus sp.]